MPGGRPPSEKRKFFKTLDGDKAECQLKDDQGNICKYVVNSASSPTNLKYHLDKSHPEIAKSIDKKATKTAGASEQVQPTMAQCIAKRKMYGKDSPESAKIN